MDFFNNTTEINHIVQLFNTIQEQVLTCIIMVIILIIFKLKKALTNVMTSITTRRNSMAASLNENITTTNKN